MKRHQAFHRLSWGHHHGLVLARRLRWNLQDPPRQHTSLPDLVDALLHTWANELQPHFAAEEEFLIPLSERLLGPRDMFSTRILVEHQTFRRLVDQISAARVDPPTCVPLLQQFGNMLEVHIRFEEREWFEALQGVLDAETFATIDAALTAHLPSPRGGAGA
jgi:hemerythrin-like domain-containing protein